MSHWHIVHVEVLDFVNSDVVCKWEYSEYKAVEDSEPFIAQFCLAAESGTFTSQVQVAVRSVSISATGKLINYTQGIGYYVGLKSYTEDVDFTNVSGTLLFEGSHGAGVCLPVTVTIIKDDLLESDETFQLSASVSSHHALFSPGGDVATILIQDNDGCKQPYKRLITTPAAFASYIYFVHMWTLIIILSRSE